MKFGNFNTKKISVGCEYRQRMVTDSEYEEDDNNSDKLEIEDIADLDIELDDLDLNLDDNEVDLNDLSESKQNEQVLNNKEAFSFYDE